MRLSLGLRSKLLAALMLMSAIVVVAMALGTRWAFEKGFVEYLAEAEIQRLQPLAKALEQAYGDHGDWSFLKTNPRAWRLLLAKFDRASSQQAVRAPVPPPIPGQVGERGVGSFGGFSTNLRRGVSPEVMRLSDRLRVLDSDGQTIFGGAGINGERQIPLRQNGHNVGWLVVASPAWLEDELDQRFQMEQQQAYFWIAVGALLIAVLLGILIAHRILIPVQRVAEGARGLASGQLEKRVPINSDDELGQLSADFNRLAETLERNESLRRQGMADASHELRTPIAVLRAELEALVDGIRECDHDRLVQLHERVTGLGRLVDDLFELARADAGALDYRMENVSFDALVEDCADMMQADFRKADLALDLDLDDTFVVWGDPDRLKQVVHNLLKNSLRYTDGGGQVKVSVQEREEQIVFDIEDSAPGVEPEHLEHLFDRFYRADASRSRHSGGTGLGLAICRNIIQAHEGEVDARISALGGLWVKVLLPKGPRS